MSPPPSHPPDHWLSKYSSNIHPWTLSSNPNSDVTTTQTFSRPLGLVETSFDIDGTYYGGRADMTCLFTLSIADTLPRLLLRKRIALAWTQLRLEHVLLSSYVSDDSETGKRSFNVPVPATAEASVKAVEDELVWIEDFYPSSEIDESELYHHAYNTARIISPAKCLSKLHILPLQQNADGTIALRFLLVIAHQISDGLSAYNWLSHFIAILNTPASQITSSITHLIAPQQIRQKLPPPQEDLYPPIPGSKARQRWFWALTRVLRHVATPLPPTFPNPLYRSTRLNSIPALPEKFPKMFSYKKEHLPPLSCGHISASLSLPTSQRLIALCRQTHVSIGAGCFALAGLAMMEIHEELYPDIPDSQRAAFAASFPLNPRAFFAKPPEADSCMLAFSEGIVMPFLPSRLAVEGRFAVVVRHANRGLRVYQKRLKVRRGGTEEVDVSLDKHSPGRLLATGVGKYGATCGVSSIGSLAAFFRRDEYGLENLGEKDFAADFRNVKIGVRARDNEFLVGSSTSSDGIISFGVSYDANAISQEAAGMWAEKISGLLEKGDGSRL
ncbi:hypothetical protein T440DRAFT_455620 [Plenodomus tracheiphilus IPT5]|uniref:CoA-dependent acyltransferase n=1 Tax=Plenodomus tracheiphilus IPT5 TaxID=1408161 RepID=A0A6A7B0I5_9PLEO|nr:hypothetical protein T440DRAFT_455620 [Plenodomus tracheiphilus IPT5]